MFIIGWSLPTAHTRCRNMQCVRASSVKNNVGSLLAGLGCGGELILEDNCPSILSIQRPKSNSIDIVNSTCTTADENLNFAWCSTLCGSKVHLFQPSLSHDCCACSPSLMCISLRGKAIASLHQQINTIRTGRYRFQRNTNTLSNPLPQPPAQFPTWKFVAS